jgi:hypothetical protein
MKYIAVLSTLLFVGCSNSDSINDIPNNSKSPDSLVSQAIDTVEIIDEKVESVPIDTVRRYNVMEYCQLIHGDQPQEFGPNFRDTQWEEKDIANGYLRFYGMMEGGNTMVLFRMNNGNALIIETVSTCGGACDQNLYMTEYHGLEAIGDAKHLLPSSAIQDQLSSTGAAMMEQFPEFDPAEYSPEIWYYLPQKGTDLKLTCEVEREGISSPLIVLGWDGAQFTVKEAFDTATEIGDFLDN